MCHENEDLEHYHLIIRRDYNKYSPLQAPVLFKNSCDSRNVTAAKVNDLFEFISQEYCNDDVVKNNNFYLSWKGQKLEPNMVIGNIEVNGEKIRLYVPDMVNPIMIMKNS